MFKLKLLAIYEIIYIHACTIIAHWIQPGQNAKLNIKEPQTCTAKNSASDNVGFSEECHLVHKPVPIPCIKHQSSIQRSLFFSPLQHLSLSLSNQKPKTQNSLPIKIHRRFSVYFTPFFFNIQAEPSVWPITI